MRLALYGVASTLLTAAVLYTNFLTPTHTFPPFRRSNFYTSAIYLSNSSASLLVLLNFGIFGTLLWGKLLQSIFFGSLRAIEVEHLYERSWFAVTETCLAMTIFREEFDAPFVTLFVALLFTKIFHWLCQDRVDFMEQSLQVSPLFHIRMITLMVNLLIADTIFVAYSVKYTIENGANMLIVFGFEYAILVAVLLATFSKYVVHMIDSRTEEAWENKSMYIFYLELVTDFMKLVIYLIFFVVVVKFYSVPLHIIRDIYVTLRSFLQKCRDLVRYRQATRNMNERYPDATMEELSRMSDPTCIICREEMVHRDDATARQRVPAPAPAPREGRPAMAADVPKKLPCGHIFHFSCLRSWLERQQSCPTCRSPVLNTDQATPQPQAPAPAQPQAPVQPQAQPPQNQAQNAPELLQQPLFLHPPQEQINLQRVPRNVLPPQPADQPPEANPGQSSAQPPQASTRVQARSIAVRAVPGQAIPSVIPLGDLSIPPGGDGIHPFRLNVMPALTDEDINRLASGTQEAITQRLELINRTQAHLVALSTVLTQALTIPASTSSRSAQNPETASSPVSAPLSVQEPAPTPATEPLSDPIQSTLHSQSQPSSPAQASNNLGGSHSVPNLPIVLSSDSDDSELVPAHHSEDSLYD